MSKAQKNKTKLNDIVSVKEFGAVGDGVANDTAAIQSAIDSFGAAGGTVIVPSDMKCLVDTSLTIKPNVSLKGPHVIMGSPADNSSAPYGNVGGCLIVNSAVTIFLKGGSSLQGLLLYRKGMTFPAANASAFAGTAVIIDGDDAAVFQCMFLGFAQAVASSGRQRPRIYDVNIDCTNGISIDNCADVAYLARCHCWPFATIAAGGAITTLQRSGNAYRFNTLGDWNKVSDCFSYGYSRGFYITNCNSMTLLGCSADSTGSFAGQLGFVIDGTSEDTRMIACQAAAQETGYFIATSASVHTRMIGCDSWASTNHGVLINSGDVSITGGIHRNAPNGITVTSASSRVFIDDVRFNAISSQPLNATVSTSNIRLGDFNDFGNFNASAAGTNLTIPSIASAATVVIPPSGKSFQITGNTGISNLSNVWAGREITLHFTSNPIITHGTGSATAIRLSGSVNFTPTAGGTLSLRHNGTQWYEIGRCA